MTGVPIASQAEYAGSIPVIRSTRNTWSEAISSLQISAFVPCPCLARL
jgi:hypothetical protein